MPFSGFACVSLSSLGRGLNARCARLRGILFSSIARLQLVRGTDCLPGPIGRSGGERKGGEKKARVIMRTAPARLPINQRARAGANLVRANFELRASSGLLWIPREVCRQSSISFVSVSSGMNWVSKYEAFEDWGGWDS